MVHVPDKIPRKACCDAPVWDIFLYRLCYVLAETFEKVSTPEAELPLYELNTEGFSNMAAVFVLLMLMRLMNLLLRFAHVQSLLPRLSDCNGRVSTATSSNASSGGDAVVVSDDTSSVLHSSQVSNTDHSSDAQMYTRSLSCQCTPRIPDAVKLARTLFSEKYQLATLDIQEGMLDDDVEPTVANLEVAIVVISCADLRREFQNQGFDSSSDRWRVEHVFTRAASEMENVSLESFFDKIPDVVREKGRTYRVIALSSAGCGKTTLFTKVVPLRWSVKELWPGMFDLLVAREFRFKDVRRAKGVSDLMGLKALDMTKEQRQEVEKFVHANPQRVCVVLDGLDETRLSKCSQFMSDVITGKVLKGLRLIITSRPCGDIFQLTESRQHDRKVELVGFRPNDVKKYIRKHLNAKEAAELLQKVSERPHAMSMMSTPVLAYEICKLYHLRKEVPMCVSDIFQMMIVRLAELRSDGETYSNWDEVPGKFRRPILSLGKFAFENLLAQRLVFSEKELRSHSVLRDAVILGLLVACDRSSGDRVKQWRFSHLTLQESLAALYVFECGRMSSRKIVQLVEFIGPDAGHMRTFWVLLAAHLDSNCLETLVNALMTRERLDEGAFTVDDLPAMDMQKPFPLNFHRILCQNLRLEKAEEQAQVLLGGMSSTSSSSSSSGTQYVWNKMARIQEPTVIAYLQTLLETWVCEVPMASTDMLLSALSSVDNGTSRICEERLKEAATHESYSKPLTDDMVLWGGAHGARRMLAFQCFSEYALHHDQHVQPVPSINASLKHKNGRVRVRGDGNPADCRTIDTMFHHHKSAVTDVHLSDFTTNGACSFPSSLRTCTDISLLSLYKCTPVSVVCDTIQSSSGGLRSLSQQGAISDMEMDVLSSAIASCSGLESLQLLNPSLSLHTVTMLSRALASLTKLKKFYLTVTPILGTTQCLEMLCTSLSTCSMMKWLTLASCGLTVASLPVIADHLKYWPSLTTLDLGLNEFQDLTEDQAQLFIDAVNVHGHIQTIDLTYCSVPSSSPVLEAISYTHHVKIV